MIPNPAAPGTGLINWEVERTMDPQFRPEYSEFCHGIYCYELRLLLIQENIKAKKAWDDEWRQYKE